MSESKSLAELAELGKAVVAIANLVAVAASLKVVAIGFEAFAVEKELEEIMGRDWIEACRKDRDCFLTIAKIAEESLEIKAKAPSEEEERKEYRRKILEELRQKLKELGIEFWCEEKDLGEIGTLYEDCYIEYKGEHFSITELGG